MEKEGKRSSMESTDWKRVCFEGLKDGISNLNPDQVAMLKYRYANGDSLVQLDRRCRNHGFELKSFEWHNGMFESDHGTQAFIRIAEATLYDSMHDKLLEAWDAAYKSDNGHSHPLYEALQNFDSLSESGWFDDIQSFDPAVADVIYDAFDDWDGGYSEQTSPETHRPFGHSVAAHIRNLYENNASGLSDSEREACGKFIECYRDGLRDCLRRELKAKVMDEVYADVSSAAWNSGSYLDKDVLYHDPRDRDPICPPYALVEKWCYGLFEHVDAPSNDIRIQQPRRGIPLIDLAKQVARQQGHDKCLWDSPDDFIADALSKYGDGKYVQALCDGSYKNGLPYKNGNTLSHFSDICNVAVNSLENDVKHRICSDVNFVISNNGDSGVREYLRDYYKSGLDPKSDSATMLNLMDYAIDDCDDSDRFTYYDDTMRGQVTDAIVPVYGYGVDFDRVFDVLDRTYQGKLDIPRDIEKRATAGLKSLDDSMTRYVAQAVADIEIGCDIERATQIPSDIRTFSADTRSYFDHNPDAEKDIVALVKERASKDSPLPDALKNAVDNLSGGDVDDDKQMGE